jgi:hypothetical protein
VAHATFWASSTISIEEIATNAEIVEIDYFDAFLGGSSPAFMASITSFNVMAVAFGSLLPIAISPLRVCG